MLGFLKRIFVDVRLVRMSDGHFAVIRDLGLVKGGRGLRRHEMVLSLHAQTVTAPILRKVMKSRGLLAKGQNLGANAVPIAVRATTRQR